MRGRSEGAELKASHWGWAETGQFQAPGAGAPQTVLRAQPLPWPRGAHRPVGLRLMMMGVVAAPRLGLSLLGDGL